MPLRSHADRHGKWLLVAFGLYLSAYLVLSRRGFAEADRTQSPGFYYVAPRNTDGWRLLNWTCVLLFRPLEIVEQWLGTGREPASEPLFGLSGGLRTTTPTTSLKDFEGSLLLVGTVLSSLTGLGRDVPAVTHH